MGHLLQGLWRQLTLLARLEDYPSVPGVWWASAGSTSEQSIRPGMGMLWVLGVASVYIHAPSSRIDPHNRYFIIPILERRKLGFRVIK